MSLDEYSSLYKLDAENRSHFSPLIVSRCDLLPYLRMEIVEKNIFQFQFMLETRVVFDEYVNQVRRFRFILIENNHGQ